MSRRRGKRPSTSAARGGRPGRGVHPPSLRTQHADLQPRPFVREREGARTQREARAILGCWVDRKIRGESLRAVQILFQLVRWI